MCTLTVTKEAEDTHDTNGNGKDLEINKEYKLRACVIQ